MRYPSFLSAAVVAAVLTSAASPAGAQAISGTYTTRNPQGGVVTLMLRPNGNGGLAGTFSGNGNSFQVQGTMGDDAADGIISGNGVGLFFSARLQGDQLELAIAEPDANGQPNFAKATRLQLRRDNGGTATGPATPPAGGVSQNGNPLARGGPAAQDKYAGSWTSKDVQLSLNGTSGKYTGQLTHQGRTYPVTLADEGPGLSGSFTTGGQKYDLLVKVDGSSLLLNTAGMTYMLIRGNGGVASNNPLAGGQPAAPDGGAAAGGGDGIGANNPRMTAQDQQIVRVLISSAWCAFSYSSGSTYATSGGTSRTERVVMRPDGTATQTGGSETTSSGPNGQAYLGGNNGQQGFWKFENGVMYVSGDRMNWVPETFKMTYNSNNSPIPIVNGREYMLCR